MSGINFRLAFRVVLLIGTGQALLISSGQGRTQTNAPDQINPIAETATTSSATGSESAPAGDPTTAHVADTQSIHTKAATSETIGEMLEDEDPAVTAIRERIAAREYDQSIAWLNQHIDLIERINHRYDAELIVPLTLLGDAYAGKGEFATALGKYERATHLIRVNRGLNDPSQVETVYREADALKTMHDYKAANDREEYAYAVLTRAHGNYSPRVLSGVYHLADWYSTTNNVMSARIMYEHALNILIATDQAANRRALPAYRGIARTYRLERFPPYYIESDTDTSSMHAQYEPEFAGPVYANNFPAGEKALQAIIAIYRANPDQYDQSEQVDAILELADWYLLWEKYSRANPLYAYAYAMVDEIDGVNPSNFFGTPKMLYFPAPKTPKRPPERVRGEEQRGLVEVTFGVSRKGYLRDLSTLVSEPEGLMDFRVRKSLRRSRYRPAIIDGVLTSHPEYRYQYHFTYFPKIANELEAEDAQ